MEFYLSSYKLGNETDKLVAMTPNRRIGYIPNALDFTGADPVRREKHVQFDVSSLEDIGLECEVVDLKDYFDDPEGLKRKLKELGAVFISGGNVFVLRQAMKLSGMDHILGGMRDEEFLYAGYSAAGCVLAPDLHAYQIVDDATDTPYEGLNEVDFSGLGLVNYTLLPHWDSDHPESADIDKEIAYCEAHGITYRKLRDGEVIIE